MWELDYKESWVPKNWCFWTVVLEKTLESPLDCKDIQPVHPKGDHCWNSNTLATWRKELTHLKRPWCCERLRAGGEGDDRGWDGWMASPTQWTWVWVDSRSWWWTGKPGTLRFMGSQSRTRLSNWTELMVAPFLSFWGTSILFSLVAAPFPPTALSPEVFYYICHLLEQSPGHLTVRVGSPVQPWHCQRRQRSRPGRGPKQRPQSSPPSPCDWVLPYEGASPCNVWFTPRFIRVRLALKIWL